MNKKYYNLFLFIIVLSIYSCRSISPPSFINSIPLHVKKGDKMVTASVSEYGIQTSFDIALTDHIGLFYANLANRHKQYNNNNYSRLSYHYYNALGAGYYKNYNKYFTLEIYGGYGLGFYGFDWTSPKKYPLYSDPTVKVSEKVVNNSYYHQLLLKWDVGFRFKYASFGVASSMSRNFNNNRYNYSMEGDEANIARFSEKRNSSMYLPIVLFSNIGLQKYKISIQAGTYTPNLNEEFNLFGSLGFSYTF